MLNTRAKVFQVPQVTEGLQNRGSTVRGRLAGDGVSTIALNVTLGGIRRQQPGRDTATQTVEAESVLAAVIAFLGEGLVV